MGISEDVKKEIKEKAIKQKNDTIEILQSIINLQNNHIENDELKNKRAFRISIIVIISFLINNIIWICAFNNREIITENITSTQESTGDGSIINGNSYRDNSTHNEEQPKNKIRNEEFK